MTRLNQRKNRRRVEAVAQIIGRSHGFEVEPNHDLGDFPMHVMSEPKLVEGRVIRENPRAVSFIKTAREIIVRLAKKDMR